MLMVLSQRLGFWFLRGFSPNDLQWGATAPRQGFAFDQYEDSEGLRFGLCCDSKFFPLWNFSKFDCLYRAP